LPSSADAPVRSPLQRAAGLGDGLAAGDAPGEGLAAGEAAAGLAAGDPPFVAGVGSGVLVGGFGAEQALRAIRPATASTSRPRGAIRQSRSAAPGTASSDMKY